MRTFIAQNRDKLIWAALGSLGTIAALIFYATIFLSSTATILTGLAEDQKTLKEKTVPQIWTAIAETKKTEGQLSATDQVMQAEFSAFKQLQIDKAKDDKQNFKDLIQAMSKQEIAINKVATILKIKNINDGVINLDTIPKNKFNFNFANNR